MKNIRGKAHVTRIYYIFARMCTESDSHFRIRAELSPRPVNGWYPVKHLESTSRRDAVLSALPPEWLPPDMQENDRYPELQFQFPVLLK